MDHRLLKLSLNVANLCVPPVELNSFLLSLPQQLLELGLPSIIFRCKRLFFSEVLPKMTKLYQLKIFHNFILSEFTVEDFSMFVDSILKMRLRSVGLYHRNVSSRKYNPEEKEIKAKLFLQQYMHLVRNFGSLQKLTTEMSCCQPYFTLRW